MPHASVIALIGVPAYPRSRNRRRPASGLAERVRPPRLASSRATGGTPAVTVMPRLYMTVLSSAIDTVQNSIVWIMPSNLTPPSSYAKRVTKPIQRSERHTDDAVHRRTDLRCRPAHVRDPRRAVEVPP